MSKAHRGKRRAAAWVTMAGVGWFTDKVKKKQLGTPGCLLARTQARGLILVYFAAVLPKRLRNFSTRPPMLSTDFWVPV